LPSIARKRLGLRAPSTGSSSKSASVRIPQRPAMATAVSRLSPVTMRTEMPAVWHFWIAGATSGRSGSSMPTTPSSTRSHSQLAAGEPSALSISACSASQSGVPAKSRKARPIVRIASEANFLM
jgi:hypothetical protein